MFVTTVHFLVEMICIIALAARLATSEHTHNMPSFWDRQWSHPHTPPHTTTHHCTPPHTTTHLQTPLHNPPTPHTPFAMSNPTFGMEHARVLPYLEICNFNDVTSLIALVELWIVVITWLRFLFSSCAPVINQPKALWNYIQAWTLIKSHSGSQMLPSLHQE